jgi:HK97 family phage portal protein
MKLLNVLAIARKAVSLFSNEQKQLSAVDGRGGWWPIVRESYSGAWQSNVEERQSTVLCYPTLYACISRISQDIGKLTFLLMEEDADQIWQKTKSPSFSPVLRKPNHYQTQQQFRESWLLSKLIQGNTYVLKVRDNRNVVVALYILDPTRVQPLVSDSGDIFYELKTDNLSLLPENRPRENLVVPAREIIHDREATLHHPLIGIPPLCAAHWPAVKNLRILRSSAEFFGNGASPGGILTAPGAISNDTATRLSEYWNTNFTGANAGKVAVVGDGLKYEQMSANAADSQLVEQMRYSDEQVCQPFGVPPFIIGIGTVPAGLKVDDMSNMYYSFALQARIEHMEALLDEGLGVVHPLGIELDTWPLLRMDREKLASVEGQLVKDGISTPNEGRWMLNKSPIEGGDTVYLQHQDYSIQALARRDAKEDPFATGSPAKPTADPQEDEEERAAVWRDKSFAAFHVELTS